MKKYFNTFVKTFFYITIPMLILVVGVYRRLDYTMWYAPVTIGTILISLIVSLAIIVFKSEKGKGYINAILGYAIIIPSLFVFRWMFKTTLFRTAVVIYILIAIIGAIYGIALLVASRKYKSEVNELNRLLLNKEKKSDEEEDNE